MPFQNKQTFFFSVAIVILLIFIGYIREVFFVHVNYQLFLNYYHETDSSYNYHFPDWLLFLKSFTNEGLMRLKWIMTMVTFLVYASITLFTVHYFFKNRTYNLIAVGIQVFLFIIAGVFFVLGKISGKGYEGYTLSREFMGILQSPLVLMILLPTFIISSRQNKTEHETRPGNL